MRRKGIWLCAGVVLLLGFYWLYHVYVAKPAAYRYPDLSFEEAEQAGYVTIGPGGVRNEGKLDRFLDDFRKGIPAKLTVVRYTIEGDPIFDYVDFDGKRIRYTYDNSRDAFAGQDKGAKSTICRTADKRTERTGGGTREVYAIGECLDDIGYSDPERKEYLLFVQTEVEKQ